MPLPKPNKIIHHNFKDWLPVCMANKNMNKDFPDNGQRYKVCQSLWNHKKSKADYIVEVGGEVYLYNILPEDEGENPLDDNEQPIDKTPDSSPAPSPNSDPEVTKKDQEENDKNNIFINPKDNMNPEQTKAAPESKESPLIKTGISPNPDATDTFNYPTSDHKNPTKPNIDDVKWLPGAEDQPSYLSDDELFTLNPDSKPKEYYISSIDEMPDVNTNAEWPLFFDRIEKDYERPNKPVPEDTKVIDKNQDKLNTKNVDKKEKPYII